MANVKITALPAYTDPVSTDVLPIVDVGNDLTKKVSIADLLENAGTGSAAAPSFSFDGDNAGIYRPGANQVAIATGGTGRLFVDANGNVLINESASVTSNVSAYLLIRQANAAADTSIGIINSQNNDANATVKIQAGHYTRRGGEIVFGRENGNNWSTVTSADGYIAFSPVLNNNNAERLRIDSSGNVFINGTTAASAEIALNADGSAVFAGGAFEVEASGAAVVTRASGAAFAARTTAGGANTALILADGSATFTGSIEGPKGDATDGTIPFLSQSTKDNTSENQSVLFSKHKCRAGSSNAYMYWKVSGGGTSSGSKGAWQLHTSRGSDTALSNDPNISFFGNGSAEFAGTVSAQGTVLTSDQRFKENITDANAQLADVTALGNSLRNWDWTADAPVADKDTRFLGLVAQEAEAICPGIVTTIARTKDGDELTPEVVVPAVYETKTVPAVLDEEGEVVEAETTEEVLITEEQVTPATYEQLDDSYKGIKNDILIMKLLGAVAELSAKVAALEAG